MAKRNTPGCKCCKCPAVSITVKGCNSIVLSGAAVVISQGGTTVASWTTNSSGLNPAGNISLAPGTYTLNVSKGRFTTYNNASFVIGSSPTCSQSVGAVTLSPAAGYTCCSGCADPVSNSWQITDAAGVHTVTLGSSVTFNVFSTNVLGCSGSGGISPTVISDYVEVTLSVTCGLSGQIFINYTAPSFFIPAQNGFPQYGPSWLNACAAATATGSGAGCVADTTLTTCSRPISGSFAMPTTWTANSFNSASSNMSPGIVAGTVAYTEL